MCPRERDTLFLTRRCVIQQCWSCLGPLVLPLGVLWLNGIVDFPLLGFLTLGLVSRAPRGWSLGHMTPHLFPCTGDPSLSCETLVSLHSHLRHPLGLTTHWCPLSLSYFSWWHHPPWHTVLLVWGRSWWIFSILRDYIGHEYLPPSHSHLLFGVICLFLAIFVILGSLWGKMPEVTHKLDCFILFLL